MTITKAALREALDRAGTEPAPSSLAAMVVAGESVGTAADSVIDPRCLELLCSAPAVMEVGLVFDGVYREHRYLHDGESAILVHLDGDLVVSPVVPIATVLGGIANEVRDADHAAIDVDIATRRGAIVVRSVRVGAAGCLAGPVIELVAPPGQRSLVERSGNGARLRPVDPDELLFLLRLTSGDRSLAFEAPDETVLLQRAEFAALVVLLERAALVGLTGSDPQSLEELVAVGIPMLEARADAGDLLEWLAAPDEELDIVLATAGGSILMHVDLVDDWATVASPADDLVEVTQTTRERVVGRIRSLMDGVDGPATLLVRRRNVRGIVTLGDLRRDTHDWKDPDGDDATSVLALLDLERRSPPGPVATLDGVVQRNPGEWWVGGRT